MSGGGFSGAAENCAGKQRCWRLYTQREKATELWETVGKTSLTEPQLRPNVKPLPAVSEREFVPGTTLWKEYNQQCAHWDLLLPGC